VEAQRRGIETLPCEVLIDTTPDQVFACKNCERPLIAGRRYCADCGQKAAMPRLTLHEIGHETLHALLHVDRSVLSLIRALSLRPGRVALDYVSGRRKRYYGPFAFLIVTVALASAAVAVTEFPAVTSDIPNAVARFLQHHVNLLFFVQVPIIAAACRVLTPRGPFNYAEYLVLGAYTAGMYILFFTVVNVGGWYLLRPSELMARDVYLALMPVYPLYLGFACAQFLPGSKWLAAVKGVAASLITYAVTQGLVFAASNVAELLTRQ
jgi:Protein of unknown function (DUF3667)